MDDDEQINMIMRQTDYTKEISEEKLKEHNNDIMSVMREYMGPSKISSKPASSKFSVNQQIFKEIRGMMDDASKTYQNKNLGGTIMSELIQKNPRDRYLANVSPQNKTSEKFFKFHGFKFIQKTYELTEN